MLRVIRAVTPAVSENRRYVTYAPIDRELEHLARIAVGRGCPEGRRLPRHEVTRLGPGGPTWTKTCPPSRRS